MDWQQIIDWIKNNEVFSGVLGVSSLGAVLYWLRGWLQRFWSWLQRQFVLELMIRDGEPAFYWVSVWLGQQTATRRARSLRIVRDTSGQPMAASSLDVVNDPGWKFAPGPGIHFMRYAGRPTMISVHEENSEYNGVTRVYYIRMLCRSQDRLRQMMAEAEALSKQSDNGVRLFTYLYNTWQHRDQLSGRPWPTVVLPEEQKARILSHSQRFFSSAQWYRERGLPWRYGILLAGPPGTGKSSLAVSLATLLNKPLYVMPLGSVCDDSSLQQGMGNVPPNAILLIEDIDVAVTASRRRDNEPKRPGELDVRRISLSMLLNCIDGVLAGNGRLLIMTTNDKDSIDPALLRPGRADLHEYVDYLDAELACELYKTIWPEADADPELWRQRLGPDWRATGASLQHLYLSPVPPGRLLSQLKRLPQPGDDPCDELCEDANQEAICA